MKEDLEEIQCYLDFMEKYNKNFPAVMLFRDFSGRISVYDTDNICRVDLFHFSNLKDCIGKLNQYCFDHNIPVW